jgi:hypothetical protein
LGYFAHKKQQKEFIFGLSNGGELRQKTNFYQAFEPNFLEICLKIINELTIGNIVGHVEREDWLKINRIFCNCRFFSPPQNNGKNVQK